MHDGAPIYLRVFFASGQTPILPILCPESVTRPYNVRYDNIRNKTNNHKHRPRCKDRENDDRRRGPVDQDGILSAGPQQPHRVVLSDILARTLL